MSIRGTMIAALAALLLAGANASAQQAGLMTLQKAEDEDLILYPWSLSVDSIEDMSVQGPDGTSYGDVEDVLVDSTGAIRAVIIDYGRTLGPADQQAIVPIERLAPQDAKVLKLDMAPAELQALPDWDD